MKSHMFHKDNPEYNRNQVGFYSLDLLVLSDHFLRQVEEIVDSSFVYDVVEDAYSSYSIKIKNSVTVIL